MLRKLRVFRLEGTGNKCSESPRLILQIAQPLKMANPVMDCFADADHHRGRGAQAKPMGFTMNHQPFISLAFERTNRLTDFIIQNFTTTSRHGVETGRLQPFDNASKREFRYAGYVQDLWR